jgi:hypothetical protein
MNKLQKMFWGGGVVAGALLIIAGGIWVWQGASARSEVHDTIVREKIVGTPDMRPEDTPAGIVENPPTCDVAGKEISSGADARCFAEYMRVHALEGTDGKTFSEMGRYLDKNGKDVFDEEQAAVDPVSGQPVTNPQRDLWVTQRALATGLELAFVGEQVSLFSIATGALFIVIGIGLLVMVLSGGVLGSPFQKKS